MALAGAAYVFVRGGATWSQQAYLKADDPDAGDELGRAVAISGDTIVVGAYNDDDLASSSGAAYVFVRSGTTWSQQAKLKASNPDLFDDFGWSVAISGETIVVGAKREASSATGVNGDQNDNGTTVSGAAYVFVRSGTSWAQEAYIKASNTDQGDSFGYSVAVTGDTIVVGAVGEDSAATGIDGDESDNSANGAGAAYVFVRSGTDWSQQAYLKASNAESGDQFGLSMSASGDTIVIAASTEDSSASGVNGDQGNDDTPGAGACYVFVRSGTSWTQEAYLKASNPDNNDRFGESIDLVGDKLLVGVLREDSSATGVNGDQSDNSAESAGAAYVFVRSGTSWAQEAYLKASNTEEGDRFGAWVALSGNRGVIGAFGEDSQATGIDGDQSDNSAPFAGAAYVFNFGESIGVNYCGPGVPNSTGAAGTIRAAGSNNANDEDVRLTASNLPPGNVCLFLASVNQGFIQPPRSCGPICLMGPDIARFRFDAQQVDGAGECSLQIDPFIVLTNPPQPILNGQTWNFQAWHRDADALPDCNNNFTDATEVTFVP